MARSKLIISRANNSLAICGQEHASGIVEQDAYTLVGQLETEAVLVGIVYPFSDPQRLGAVNWGWRRI